MEESSQFCEIVGLLKEYLSLRVSLVDRAPYKWMYEELLAKRDSILPLAEELDPRLHRGLVGFYQLDLPGQPGDLPAYEFESEEVILPEGLRGMPDGLRDIGRERHLEGLLNPLLEQAGYVAHLEISSTGQHRNQVLHLLRRVDSRKIACDDSTAELLFANAGESATFLSAAAHADIERKRIILFCDRVRDAPRMMSACLEKAPDEIGPGWDIIQQLYRRSLEEDKLTLEASLLATLQHEVEHLRYGHGTAPEARKLSGAPDILLPLSPDAEAEAVPWLTNLCEGDQTYLTLARIILAAQYAYDEDTTSACRLILSLLSQYNAEHGGWIDTGGDTLLQRLRNFPQLSKEQICEAAGYWHREFYEMKRNLGSIPDRFPSD